MDWKSLWDRTETWDEWVAGSVHRKELLERCYSEAELTSEAVESIKGYQRPTRVVAISEDWCGDVRKNVPPAVKLFDQSPDIQTRILKRDENPEVMDHYLTGGSRSIPILVFLDEDFQEFARWGPRPAECQAILTANRDTMEMKDIYPLLKKWYQENKTDKLVQELVDTLKKRI